MYEEQSGFIYRYSVDVLSDMTLIEKRHLDGSENTQTMSIPTDIFKSIMQRLIAVGEFDD